MSLFTAGILAAGMLISTPASSSNHRGPGGRDGPVLPFFSLEDLEGRVVSLREPNVDVAGTVVAFLSPNDEASATDAELLVELAADYAAEGFRFLWVIADRDVKAGPLADWVAEVGVQNPVLPDAMQGVSDRWAIERLGTVVLLDSEDREVYRGAVEGEEAFLLDAIESLMIEEPPPFARSEGSGRPLLPMEERLDAVDLEFHRDVAPLLERHCVACHREGRIGPMSLIEFEDVRGWAPMIAEVVEDGSMPPWSANPRYGKFLGERRLTDTEKATLKQWAALGAPKGEVSAARAVSTVEDELWRIGEPDAVYELPEDQSIPATGVVDYRYVLLDPEIDEDRWASAIEVRHTAPQVTHHILVYLIPEGMNWPEFMRSQSDLGRGLIAGVAPGTPADILEPGTARRIPAGSRFLFQLHYTPNGEPAVDRSQMAVRWADPSEVDYEMITRGVTNYRLDIKPQLDDQTFHARFRLPEPMLLVGMSPHMHSRGKSFRYELLSGGDEEILLDVPEYDFNWQHAYMLTEPRALEAGDLFYLTAVYDNSEDNLSNPNPDARVRWGDQTFDEMFLGWIYARVPVVKGE